MRSCIHLISNRMIYISHDSDVIPACKFKVKLNIYSPPERIFMLVPWKRNCQSKGLKWLVRSKIVYTRLFWQYFMRVHALNTSKEIDVMNHV
jgi:hypothetical protein